MPNANQVWINLLKKIYETGEEVRPRGLLCKEILANTSVVDMNQPVVTSRPKLGHRFLAAEAWWILSGRNDVESIKTYSPHITSFSNDGLRFDGAYGPRIVDQLRYVVDTLWEDPESRQAVIEIWRPNPRPSKDIPCTIALQWVIRGGKLHCFDTMRSSDAWLGWPYDVFNFSMLSAYIALMLRDRSRKDPLVRARTAPSLGNLHLTAGSQHLYVNPKQDGAINIPYAIQDVEAVLMAEDHFEPYDPLELDAFHVAGDLVYQLGLCKDNHGQFPWLVWR